MWDLMRELDFDGNGTVNLVDFLQFVAVFGKTYPTADLIVESPSVNKSSLGARRIIYPSSNGSQSR